MRSKVQEVATGLTTTARRSGSGSGNNWITRATKTMASAEKQTNTMVRVAIFNTVHELLAAFAVSLTQHSRRVDDESWPQNNKGLLEEASVGPRVGQSKSLGRNLDVAIRRLHCQLHVSTSVGLAESNREDSSPVESPMKPQLVPAHLSRRPRWVLLECETATRAPLSEKGGPRRFRRS